MLARMGNPFPHDENGQVLHAMHEQGVDLTIERDVEFAHRVPDEAAAAKLADRARALGYDVEVFEPDEESLEEGDTDWDVICIRRMVPTHGEITRIEAELGAAAREVGGGADGWGFVEG